MANRIHVVPNEGRWQVTREDRDDVLFTHGSREEAERDAQRFAREQGDWDVVVHGDDD